MPNVDSLPEESLINTGATSTLSDIQDVSQDISAPQPEFIKWSFKPWKEHPLRALAVIIINLAITLLIYFLYRDLVMTDFAFLVMFGMTLTIYIPVTYLLDDAGVTVIFLSVKSFRPWSHYKNCYFHENGVFLTSLPKPSRLDPFRGHFIRFSKDRELISLFIKSHLKKPSSKNSV